MKEQIRFYRWQGAFSPEEELAAAQVASLPSFVRAYLLDGEVARAETVVAPDDIEIVVYYNQVPSNELMNGHHARYGTKRFSVSLPRRLEGEYTVLEQYDYDHDGVMIDRVKTMMSNDESPIREWRYDRNGALCETVEYEYAANGEVALVRSRAPDGTIIHEDRPPLSE